LGGYRRTLPGLWGESLYTGSAEFYRDGRLPYPQRLADAIRSAAALDGRGTLLDLGCGPGALTNLLAPLFASVLAVDADVDMIRVGRDAAVRQGIANVQWQRAFAEDLDERVGAFDVVTLAQSFHWMDRPLVAAKIRTWLAPDGCCVHVGAFTHKSAPDVTGLPHPTPPRERIDELVRTYLGPQPRAGDTFVTDDATRADEQVVFRVAGFAEPETVEVPCNDVFERSADQVVASVLSLSSATPRLLGDRLGDFVADLHSLLDDASPGGVFSEQLQDMTVRVWRPE
jgi:SAM-dependent methyltransferase